MSELDPRGAIPPAPGPTPAGEGAYVQQLHRALSMKENILVTLSAVTPASSVFIIVPTVLLGVGGASVLTMLIGGVAAFFVALCYAELAATYPITGGEYTWAARLLGKPAGFSTFVLTLVSGVLIVAVIALGTGEYLGVAWPALGGKWIGVGVIVGIATWYVGGAPAGPSWPAASRWRRRAAGPRPCHVADRAPSP